MAELLYTLKAWLTVPDAAAHLSIAFGQEVIEAEVLRLGLDGHLTLSVNFVNETEGRLVSREQATARKSDPSAPVQVSDLFPEGKNFTFTAGGYDAESEKVELISIDGICELAMLGHERVCVENEYQRLTGGPAVDIADLNGTFVIRPDGTLCQLHTRVLNSRGALSSLPARTLPDGADLVVRTTALDDLKARISESSSPDGDEPRSVDKPLRTTERTSLLIIIAGLAKLAQIDVAKPSTAGKTIQVEIDKLGAKLGQRTIEEHLKRIPDALERKG